MLSYLLISSFCVMSGLNFYITYIQPGMNIGHQYLGGIYVFLLPYLYLHHRYVLDQL